MEGSELSPSRKKLLKKVDKAIEVLDNQIHYQSIIHNVKKFIYRRV
jgi:hypothetical protein